MVNRTAIEWIIAWVVLFATEAIFSYVASVPALRFESQLCSFQAYQLQQMVQSPGALLPPSIVTLQQNASDIGFTHPRRQNGSI